MRKEDCFYLGKIAKKFSFKGEVLLYLDTDQPELYENLESVFVEFGKDLIPFFIEESSIHRNSFLRVRFEDINSEVEADKIIGTDVYLPLSMLPKLSGNQFYFHEIIGFSVEDSLHGTIGNVASVNDSGPQSLFVIEYQEKEILVPLIDDFIVKIDRENKTLHLKTPPGLVDLYLEG
jgi:16S rRNA processing protein RimM